jgi:hypothetical protein
METHTHHCWSRSLGTALTQAMNSCSERYAASGKARLWDRSEVCHMLVMPLLSLCVVRNTWYTLVVLDKERGSISSSCSTELFSVLCFKGDCITSLPPWASHPSPPLPPFLAALRPCSTSSRASFPCVRLPSDWKWNPAIALAFGLGLQEVFAVPTWSKKRAN